jgi:alkaline phosphatase D
MIHAALRLLMPFLCLGKEYLPYMESRFNATKYGDADGYVRLRESKATKVIGVWDDHDYGQGNGNMSFVGKEEVKRLFLDFIDEEAGSERREPGRGIYQDYMIERDGVRVHIVLLDVRYDYDEERNDRLGPA